MSASPKEVTSSAVITANHNFLIHIKTVHGVDIDNVIPLMFKDKHYTPAALLYLLDDLLTVSRTTSRTTIDTLDAISRARRDELITKCYTNTLLLTNKVASGALGHEYLIDVICNIELYLAEIFRQDTLRQKNLFGTPVSVNKRNPFIKQKVKWENAHVSAQETQSKLDSVSENKSYIARTTSKVSSGTSSSSGIGSVVTDGDPMSSFINSITGSDNSPKFNLVSPVILQGFPAKPANYVPYKVQVEPEEELSFKESIQSWWSNTNFNKSKEAKVIIKNTVYVPYYKVLKLIDHTELAVTIAENSETRDHSLFSLLSPSVSEQDRKRLTQFITLVRLRLNISK
jgi:hypothetical protein